MILRVGVLTLWSTHRISCFCSSVSPVERPLPLSRRAEPTAFGKSHERSIGVVGTVLLALWFKIHTVCQGNRASLVPKKGADETRDTASGEKTSGTWRTWKDPRAARAIHGVYEDTARSPGLLSPALPGRPSKAVTSIPLIGPLAPRARRPSTQIPA